MCYLTVGGPEYSMASAKHTGLSTVQTQQGRHRERQQDVYLIGFTPHQRTQLDRLYVLGVVTQEQEDRVPVAVWGALLFPTGASMFVGRFLGEDRFLRAW